MSQRKLATLYYVDYLPGKAYFQVESLLESGDIACTTYGTLAEACAYMSTFNPTLRESAND